MNPHDDLTRLLRQAGADNQAAVDALLPLVYDELRRIAHQRLDRHRPGQTINTTALVHEAYIRLVDRPDAQWNDRAHFFATASRAMRFILVDYVRRRTADKRGGAEADLPLDGLELAADTQPVALLALDEALGRLNQMSERLGRLVELKFFGGLSFVDIAEVTGQNEKTVRRDWAKARLWLNRELQTML